jgi:TetR/AcrR family transcriptional repressor of nem operon
VGRRSDARERLLTSAHQLFRDNGFEAVGVAQLCASAGVNKGSFYHFFASKRELLLEVIDGAWDETGLLAQWETSAPARPMVQLRRYLEELFAYHFADREEAGRVRGSLLGNLALELSSRDREVAGKLEELFARETAAFGRLLTEATDRGEIALGTPDRAAEAIVACIQGLLLLAKVRNNLDALPDSEADLLRLAGVTQPYL